MKEEKKKLTVPISEKYLLTVNEAAVYFNIGQKKIRQMAEDNLGRVAVFNGNKLLVVRPKMEEHIAQCLTL